jgi:hypothetical protein
MVLEEIGWEGESWLGLAEDRDSRRAGLAWLRIGTVDELLWSWLRNFGFYKTRGISSLSEELLDFQGLCSMNLIYFDVTAKLWRRGQSDIECCRLNAVILRSVGQFHWLLDVIAVCPCRFWSLKLENAAAEKGQRWHNWWSYSSSVWSWNKTPTVANCKVSIIFYC